VSNALLGPSKRRKRRVCRDPTPPDNPTDSDTDRVVPFADDSTEEDEEQEADCPCGTGRLSEDYSGEQWLRCAKYLSRAHTLCAGIKTLYVSLVTDNL